MHAVFAGMTRTPRVKVCCIASIHEAELALQAGADALGLVSAMPSGPGVISDADITTIARWIDTRAASVLLTSRTSAREIAHQLDESGPAVLQLTDAVAEDELNALRASHPGTALMPVVHVRDEDSVAEAVAYARVADAILLDSGNPSAAVKELGGTGRVHDWQVSRTIREAIGVPLFLAGGLKPSNVADAVRTVQPFGVDVCSGVRVQGRLDRALVTEFIAAARSGN